jgi:hypothetical protein
MITGNRFFAITNNGIYFLEFAHVYLPLWLKLKG